VPDQGCEWADALGNAGADFGDGLPSVAIEVELAFERRVDGLDHLAQQLEEAFPTLGFSPLSAGRRSSIPAVSMRASNFHP
jgi:hypothetical protein